MELSVPDTIRLMLAQNALFNIKVPNKTTIDTFTAADSGQDVVKCENAENMFAKLGI
jgi:antitoxin component of RelBE/YafQ-DinJ toxin-antitoxin module